VARSSGVGGRRISRLKASVRDGCSATYASGHEAADLFRRRRREIAGGWVRLVVSGVPIQRWSSLGPRVFAACALALGVFAAQSAYARGATVRIRVVNLVDRSRSISLPSGRRVARMLETVVRYPSTGGPFPLIVFAHGFALTPARYAELLDSWAARGYVVAAPVFPLTSTNAPGGPTESDLFNQPRDMSFVITRLLALSRHSIGVLAGEIDPASIAVAGQSDGGITALAAAYDSRYRDWRVRAALVLSGARLPGMASFPRRGPPLLAVQGTADPLNSPSTTATFFALAARPKFLLWLLGASHLPPYTNQQPQLGIVERATVAFLDHYLKGRPLDPFERAARRPRLTRLVADP
jgi:dienelactone hydrolase